MSQHILLPSEEYEETISPMKGNWTLKIKGSRGDKIDTNLVSSTNISAAMNLNSSTRIHKGEKLKISAYMISSGQKVTDEDLIKKLNGRLMVKRLPDSKADEVKLTLKGNSFEGEYVVAQKGEYEFAILLQSETQAIKSEAITLTTENNTPQAISTIENIVLSPDGKAVKIDLANYFKDTDDDELVYSTLNNTEQFVKTSISGSTLEIIPVNKGQANIKITAKDTVGAAVSQTFNIKVRSKVMQFLSKSYVLMILMLLIFTSVIIIIMAHRKVSSYK